MAKQIPNDQIASAPAAWDALAWNNPFKIALGPAGDAWLKACVDWQQEVVRFVGVRLAEDQKARETLATCANFGDALKVQQEWAQAAAKEYTEEATRLAQIASSFVHVDAVAAEQPRQTPPAPRVYAAE